MKPLLTALLVLGTGTLAFTQANTKLSNLVSPTAANQHLLPSSTNTKDLGSSSYSWRNQHLRGYVYLDGTRFVSNHPGTTAFNAFVGANSGFDITTGTNNSALGAYASNNTTSGSGNTAVGRLALYSNQTGSKNIAVGYKALYSSVANSYNVAIGDSALFKYNNGVYEDYMVAIGRSALTNNTTGYSNTATGGRSLTSNTTGSHNTANGVSALYYNITGSLNTAIGYISLLNNITGEGNTVIGAQADVSSGALTNATAIGYNAWATASNQVMLGSTSVTSVKAAGSFVLMSDQRFKSTPEENVPGLDFIRELRPVTYHYNVGKLNAFLNKGRLKAAPDSRVAAEAHSEAEQQAIARKERKLYTGFIAQEVEQVAQKLNYEFSGVHKPENEGDTYGLSYSDFVVPLVKAMQELDSANRELKVEVNALKTVNVSLIERLNKLEVTLIKANGTVTYNSATLEQNIPNPVDGTTTIRYTIPETTTAARLTLTNQKGQVIKTISVTNKGAGQISLNTTMLAVGTYHYTLYVDGKQADTKRLLITR